MRQLTNPHDRVLTYQQGDSFARVLASLAHPNRLRIMSLALAAPDGIRPFELREATGLSGPGLKWHLTQLVREGFLVRDRVGRPYKVVPGALDYVASFLAGPR